MTHEQITEIYDKAFEDKPQAGQDVHEANHDIETALDNYCNALQYETFLWTYALGYQHGKDVSA